MACKTLLDLIATNKREEEKNEILFPTSEAKKSIDTQYALDGFFEEVKIPFNGNPVVYSPDPLSVGQIYLEDHFDLNIHIPKTFEIQSVSEGDISVIDMPAIADVSEGFYRAIIPCNFYASQEYEFIGMAECPPFSEQEANYLDYVRRLQNNGRIFDVFNIFKGEKTSDTPIGLIGAEALNNHFQINLKENAVQLVGEYLETDPFRFINTNNILRVPYDITVPKTALGKVGLLLEKLSGAYIPFSLLPEDAFNLENKSQYSNSEYTRILMEYTGKGQKQSLQTHLLQNKFKPLIIDDNYAVKDNQYLYIGTNAPAPFADEFSTEYNFDIDVFQNPVYGVSSTIKNTTNDELFSSPNDFNFAIDEEKGKAIWDQNTENKFNSKSLLFKTKTIVNKEDQVDLLIDSTKREFQIREGGEVVTISKGDSVTAFADWPDTGLDYKVKKGDFFRTWTKDRKYSKLNRAIAHRGLDRGIPSVLGQNGLVNIAPTYRSSNGTFVDRYMFSIENLAWNDFLSDLPDCEKGIGDILTGHRGRLMWFPPYDLNFTESVSPSWNDHNFIGRGEPIYTYNNTKRSGSLSFTMIVDHPMIVNKLRGQRLEVWERYFKGDESILATVKNIFTQKLNQQEIDLIENLRKNNIKQKKTTEPIIQPEQQKEKKLDSNAIILDRSAPIDFVKTYFPNNVSDIPVRSGDVTINAGYQSKYQVDGLDYTYYKGVKRDKIYEKKTGKLAYENKINYGFNDNFFDDEYITNQFNTMLFKAKENSATTIYINFIGYASQANPVDTTNYALSEKRANNLKSWFTSKLNKFKTTNDIGDLKINLDNLVAMSDFLSPNTGSDVARDDRSVVEARRGEITFEFESSADDTVYESTLPEVTINGNLTQDANLETPNLFGVEDLSPDILEKLLGISECDMFEYLETYDPHSYKTISEKIKYFEPAYHSMTPEGFNGRLNFLHQCTRQSQNIGIDGIDNLTNFAFGRPPVCILRVGDFYHTKFIITNMSIDYTEQPKWDLNPEGFVAPMIAKINLSIEFIGGQSLVAPINRLQNALSFNYYASMNMFDPRSDSVVINDEGAVISDGIKLNRIINSKTSVNTKNVPQQTIPILPTPNIQNSGVVSQTVERNRTLESIQLSLIQLKAQLDLPFTQSDLEIYRTF